MTGMTSVTFRKLPVESIVSLVKAAGLDGIEWGGDIHVPQGDAEKAKFAGEATEKAGLTVLSYGSYYRLCTGSDPTKEFAPVLNCALELKAPVIRIWAGGTSPDAADEAYYRRAADETRIICEMAARYSIEVCYEYHRHTLTQTCESALRLLKMAGSANLRTYWQPNPDLSHEENCRELKSILPFLQKIHTFHWGLGDTRHRLSEGVNEWLDYIAAAREGGADPDYILEFVKDDSPEIFAQDAETLRGMLNGRTK